MPERKRFLLRVHPRLYSALEKWAADDLRSVNGQIEYVLSEALRGAGRLKGTLRDEVAGAASAGAASAGAASAGAASSGAAGGRGPADDDGE